MTGLTGQAAGSLAEALGLALGASGGAASSGLATLLAQAGAAREALLHRGASSGALPLAHGLPAHGPPAPSPAPGITRLPPWQ